jgi:hypothetical protein
MDYEKYSKRRFEELGVDSSPARTLADDLQDDVSEELHGAVLAAFQQIVSKLNAEGHNLTPYGEIRVGDMPFRDEPDGETCYLRLACDVTISAGYGHTISAREAD